MDVIKVEPHSDSEEDPLSPRCEEELTNMKAEILLLTVPALEAESQVCSF